MMSTLNQAVSANRPPCPWGEKPRSQAATAARGEISPPSFAVPVDVVCEEGTRHAPRKIVRRAGNRRVRAFSLMELLLAVSIMTVIVTALYSMFFHTQRALRANVNQVDVTESGRASMDLLTRELTQMSPTMLVNGANFLARISDQYVPVIQPLPPSEWVRGQLSRTNLLQEMLFFTRRNQEFVGTLYRVVDERRSAKDPLTVGTLMRFSTNIHVRELTLMNAVDFVKRVSNPSPESYVPIAEGVIHFRVEAYDHEGVRLAYQNRDLVERYRPNVILRRDPYMFDVTKYEFRSNALPSYLDVELGVIEPETFEQYQTFSAGSAFARGFLSNHVGQVQLFRQRIPVRESASFYAAYP